MLDCLQCLTLPVLFAKMLKSAVAQPILDDSFAEWQVAEFERKNMILPDERRAEASPEPEKEHAIASMVTPERLQSRVIDHAHRFPKRFGEVESGPAFPEVLRIDHDLSFLDRSREADRDRIEIP